MLLRCITIEVCKAKEEEGKNGTKTKRKGEKKRIEKIHIQKRIETCSVSDSFAKYSSKNATSS